MAYGEKEIVVLKGLEGVRRRPGMYIGDTGLDGYHHLLWEILDNAVDEALNGHADEIHVLLQKDGSVSISDNGRGIPFSIHATEKVPAVQVILTNLHSGAKFGGGAYKTAGGLHGVGSTVVNALSAWLHVQIARGGQLYDQMYRKGVPQPPKITRASKAAHGTTVKFKPDPAIFGNAEFDYERILSRVKVKAYLVPGVKFCLNNDCFQFEDGLRDLVEEASTLGELGRVAGPFYLRGERAQLALLWTDSADSIDKLGMSFANGIPTRDGGVHLNAVKSLLVESVRAWMTANGGLPKNLEPSDFREGVMAAIHVFVDDPQFQGQTKDRLNNPEAKAIVYEEVKALFEKWLTTNPKQSAAIAQRVIDAANARSAIRSARTQIKRKAVLGRTPLPGKLADCSSPDRDLTELFIVEGDSAGGSAKQGRDRTRQAVLPLRGKVINAVREDPKRVFANQEIKDLVECLGTGVGTSFDISKLRYGKIILLMDADVDGRHISVLLLSFLFTHMRELIEAGKVFLAVPPLYRVELGSRTTWATDDASLRKMMAKVPKRIKAQARITYFKGLGEMPAKTLFETTMDPRSRKLQKVEIPQEYEVLTRIIVEDLMGKDTAARVPYIENYTARETDLVI